MKSLTLTFLSLIVMLISLVAPVYAEESMEADIEMRIEQAREKLQEAAQTLAQLEAKGIFSGERKLMIGILLADSGGKNKGIGLAGVMPSGGAEEAGLQAGDTVTAINGVRLDEGKALKALRGVMKDVSEGDSINLEYIRDDAVYNVDVYPKQSAEHMVKIISGAMGDFDMDFDFDFDMPDVSALAEMKGLEEFINIRMGGSGGLELRTLEGSLADYFDVDSGVLVLGVGDDNSDLLAGDVIQSVAGENVSTAREAHKALAKSEGNAELSVVRQGKEHSVDVDATDYPNFSWSQSSSKSDDDHRVIVVDKRVKKDTKD